MLLYALTILVSAFLLFQVEPVIAKIILPWFGGSAAVWTTCLLFFQVVLLLGYLYAHGLFRYLLPRSQMLLHGILLLSSLLVLPVLPRAGWKPLGNEDPTIRILGLLAATIGLPYFLLSTTGPLLQAWYARRYRGAFPYRLFALSNAGSMFALLSYPVLFEPVFTTRQQAVGWSFGYLGFVLLCGTAALLSGTRPPVKVAEDEPPGAPPGVLTCCYWIALPACASVLLLAATNHLSQNVAAIPFLWVLPLSIYLLTFILCFEGSGWYRRYPYLQLFAVAVGGMMYSLSEDFQNTSVKVLLPLFAVGLFLCCMVCHGELARMKPHPRYLTHFYLMISVGGALGGIFVALVAPHVFRGYFEMPIGLVITAALVLLVLRNDPGSGFGGAWTDPKMIVAAVLVLALAGYAAFLIRNSSSGQRLMVRNFYGELKVADEGTHQEATRKLTHGTINHGEQFLDASRRDQPTTYYGPQSGVGIAIRKAQESGAVRVGVIGLGTGTLAAYGRPGDYYRFYEINPLVIDIARREFFFLRDCKAKLDIALGDARLSLEREPVQNFDVLAVDAFSSDSIPVHLLTSEAFALYFRHVKPDGVLAVHVSNKYLNLQPVVQTVSDVMHKAARMIDTEDDDANAIFGSTWVLVSGRSGYFDLNGVQQVASPVDKGRDLRLWTDDYSNLFQILK